MFKVSLSLIRLALFGLTTQVKAMSRVEKFKEATARATLVYAKIVFSLNHEKAKVEGKFTFLNEKSVKLIHFTSLERHLTFHP